MWSILQEPRLAIESWARFAKGYNLLARPKEWQRPCATAVQSLPRIAALTNRRRQPTKKADPGFPRSALIGPKLLQLEGLAVATP
jgi:hypothetical protein